MEPTSAPEQDTQRRVMLGVLSACSFVMPLSTFILVPLLVDLSLDFQVSVAQAGQLVTLTSLPAAALAVLIGPLSDAYGRRALLLGGTGLLGISSLASSIAPSYELMAASRLLSGVGAAAMGPTTFAAVGDLFPYRERGRAYGYLLGAQTLSLLLGIPLATVLAAVVNWRWSFAAVGLMSCAAVPVLALLYHPSGDAGENRPGTAAQGGFLKSYLRRFPLVLGAGSARGLLGSSLSMSIGWMAFQTYLGAFFITQYHLATGDLAVIFGTAGVGLFLGSQIAGRLGDRIGHKRIMSLSVLVAGGLVLVLIHLAGSATIGGLINFAMSIPLGMRFTSASTIISEAVPEARGTMSAINQSAFNAGSMVGAFLGGLLVEAAGYGALSLLTVAGCIASAGIIGLFVTENRLPEPEVVAQPPTL